MELILCQNSTIVIQPLQHSFQRLQFIFCIRTFRLTIRHLQFDRCNSTLAIRPLQFDPCNSTVAIRPLQFDLAIRPLQFDPCNSTLAIRRCNSTLAIRTLAIRPLLLILTKLLTLNVESIIIVVFANECTCTQLIPVKISYRTDDPLPYAYYCVLQYTTTQEMKHKREKLLIWG